MKRRPPTLVISVPLEGGFAVQVVADSFEDEVRLVAWLRRSRELQRLPALVLVALDSLELPDDTSEVA